MAKVNLIMFDSEQKDKRGNDKIVAWVCSCSPSQVIDLLKKHPTWYSKRM